MSEIDIIKRHMINMGVSVKRLRHIKLLYVKKFTDTKHRYVIDYFEPKGQFEL